MVKVSILGAGSVGSTTAHMLACRDICDIVLWNRTEGKARGIALDIWESAPTAGFDRSVTGTGDLKAIRGSDVVVLTAGAPRKEGMSRDELLKTNAGVVRPIAEQVKRHAPESKLIVLTNPLDAMVYLAKRVTGFRKQHVVGMAGILDSSRFRAFIAEALGIGAGGVSAMVLGGHGDSMVPVVSTATANGVPVGQLLGKSEIEKVIEHTRNAGAEIISLEKESSAYYAPASSLVTMVESMLMDRREVLPCTAYLTGEYGVDGIFLGVPVVLGAGGVEKVVEMKLAKNEAGGLKKSAGLVQTMAKQVDAFLRP